MARYFQIWLLNIALFLTQNPAPAVAMRPVRVSYPDHDNEIIMPEGNEVRFAPPSGKERVTRLDAKTVALVEEIQALDGSHHYAIPGFIRGAGGHRAGIPILNPARRVRLVAGIDGKLVTLHARFITSAWSEDLMAFQEVVVNINVLRPGQFRLFNYNDLLTKPSVLDLGPIGLIASWVYRITPAENIGEGRVLFFPAASDFFSSGRWGPPRCDGIFPSHRGVCDFSGAPSLRDGAKRGPGKAGICKEGCLLSHYRPESGPPLATGQSALER